MDPNRSGKIHPASPVFPPSAALENTLNRKDDRSWATLITFREEVY